MKIRCLVLLVFMVSVFVMEGAPKARLKGGVKCSSAPKKGSEKKSSRSQRRPENGAQVDTAAYKARVRRLLSPCRLQEMGTAQKLSKLLKRGDIDINRKLGVGEELPLLVAADAGNLEAVTVLLEQSADCNLRDDWRQNTVLHYVSENGHDGVLRLLKDFLEEADFKQLAKKRNAMADETILYLAAGSGHDTVVRLLYEWLGDDFQELAMMQNNFGQTALHFVATQLYDEETIGVLEECLGRIAFRKLAKVKDNDGYTALELAEKKRSRPVVVKLLKELLGEENDEKQLGCERCKR